MKYHLIHQSMAQTPSVSEAGWRGEVVAREVVSENALRRGKHGSKWRLIALTGNQVSRGTWAICGGRPRHTKQYQNSLRHADSEILELYSLCCTEVVPDDMSMVLKNLSRRQMTSGGGSKGQLSRKGEGNEALQRRNFILLPACFVVF